MQLNIARFNQFWGTIRTEASNNQKEEFSELDKYNWNEKK